MTRRRQSLEERWANVARQMMPGTLGGRIRSATPISAPLATLISTPPRQTGGAGKELATVVVAADDSHESGKTSANYVCDGTADEVEINQALRDAAALGGGRVVLLEGNFYLTPDAGTIVTFSDTGIGNGYVVLEGQGAATVIHSGAASVQTSIYVNLAYCEVRDLKVDLTGSSSSLGVELDQEFCVAQNVIVENGLWGISANDGANAHLEVTGCVIINTTDYGIVATAGPYTRIIGNAVTGGGTGVGIYSFDDDHLIAGNVVKGWAQGIAPSAQRVVVVANVISDCSGEGIVLQTNSQEDVVVQGNVISDCAYGVRQLNSRQRGVIAYNVIDTIDFDGISLSNGDDFVVRGNLIRDAGRAAANTHNGILITGNADRTNVQANVVRCSTGSVKYGINVATADCNDTLVTNNDVRGSYGTAGINNAGTGTVTAAGNRL